MSVNVESDRSIRHSILETRQTYLDLLLHLTLGIRVGNIAGESRIVLSFAELWKVLQERIVLHNSNVIL